MAQQSRDERMKEILAAGDANQRLTLALYYYRQAAALTPAPAAPAVPARYSASTNG